ncbi:hypothetical protein [Synechococcus sp. JA-3-3Ab]|uniref:hypothetical protein n=1 Tax=Synechococcus sp. (strain JA-3-3Ab) TaxID=321327 RepID=UPI00164F0B30|nr:hypothetical protein [Synechococcus sp. JA-3-3Ab]
MDGWGCPAYLTARLLSLPLPQLPHGSRVGLSAPVASKESSRGVGRSGRRQDPLGGVSEWWRRTGIAESLDTAAVAN